jgi:hypothetical protein
MKSLLETMFERVEGLRVTTTIGVSGIPELESLTTVPVPMVTMLPGQVGIVLGLETEDVSKTLNGFRVMVRNKGFIRLQLGDVVAQFPRSALRSLVVV